MCKSSGANPVYHVNDNKENFRNLEYSFTVRVCCCFLSPRKLIGSRNINSNLAKPAQFCRQMNGSLNEEFQARRPRQKAGSTGIYDLNSNILEGQEEGELESPPLWQPARGKQQLQADSSMRVELVIRPKWVVFQQIKSQKRLVFSESFPVLSVFIRTINRQIFVATKFFAEKSIKEKGVGGLNVVNLRFIMESHGVGWVLEKEERGWVHLKCGMWRRKEKKRVVKGISIGGGGKGRGRGERIRYRGKRIER
uniref:Uncharacterized protein n=1 Tax=Cucumis melo TaxID=3656 RepID=A0A9I9EFC3_CUCME